MKQFKFMSGNVTPINFDGIEDKLEEIYLYKDLSYHVQTSLMKQTNTSLSTIIYFGLTLNLIGKLREKTV